VFGAVAEIGGEGFDEIGDAEPSGEARAVFAEGGDVAAARGADELGFQAVAGIEVRRGRGAVRGGASAESVFEEVVETVEFEIESAWGQRSWFAKAFE
jgi:hypothetical protein